jgi:DNA (cytosine-5)-methyltransferase 1
MSAPTVISTFSGPGGSSLGYERAGCDVRAALDCAPGSFSNEILTTYETNHPDTNLIVQDAKETTPNDLLEGADVSVGELDIFDGSPPCSPFSSANTHVNWGDHKDGTLFDTYSYFVSELQPKTFVAENVPDLAQGKTKGYYKQLCHDLRDAGYNLTVQNIDAAYLGAAHHRRRLMFIGVREDIGTPPEIEPTQSPTTVREAWDGLDRDPDAVRTTRKKMEQSDNYEHYCRMAPGQTLDDIVGRGYSHFRLSYRKPSRTILSGGNYVIPPDEDRFCTIGEIKRLIGIPDSYEVPPSYHTAKSCCIRCLPPILLETIANELQETVL